MKAINSAIKVLLILFLYCDISSGNTHLNSYRWRNDDGDAQTATWKDSINTSIILTDKNNIRLRFQYEIHDPASINISLGYTEDLSGGPWIHVTRSDTGVFSISPSPYLSDTAIYYSNQLMPWEAIYSKYRRTITIDSSESYSLIAKDTGSIYELEYSIKPNLKIKPASGYYFFLFENGQPFWDYTPAVLLTPPVSWVARPVKGKYINSVYNFQVLSFIDENNGRIIGYVYNNDKISCIMLRTTDGGNTWIEKTIPLQKERWLNSAFFTSADTGTAVGSSGTILRTTNGGNDWLPQNSGTTSNLISVFFTSADSGTVIGPFEYYNNDNLVLRTTDGGKTWTRKHIKSPYLSAVHFPDPYNGYIVGDSGMVVKTTDGGENWSILASGLASRLSDVFFTDKNNGVAVGYNSKESAPFSKTIILRTTDGGSNWIKSLENTGSGLSSVYFINKSTGWAVGGTGRILKTTDGGINWVKLVSGVSFDLFDVQFVNEKCGFAVGNNGKILRTTNGGAIVSVPEKRNKNIPDNFYLSQNYPNPFNPSTTIEYSLAQPGAVLLEIYDVLGRRIKTVVNKWQAEGCYKINWQAQDLPSGIYFYRIKSGEYTEAKKMLLIR